MMTEEQFYKSWREESLKDGVLTIPESVTELPDRLFWECEEIRKVVLPANGVQIPDYLFHDCANLEEIKNFPPTYHIDEEFFDEETGENVHIVSDHPCEVADSAFLGCYKLFKDKHRIDEEGAVCFDIEGKSYYMGIPDSTPSFCGEMSALITKKYIESGLADKTAFCFQEKISRYGTDYEYVFENGALYNKTIGTWLLYLPDFCNKHLVIPEWVKEVDIRNCDLRNRCNDIRSLKFLGGTDLRSFCAASFEQLESIEFSDKHSVIPADYMFQAFCHCPNLITAKFGCPDCKLDKDVFSGSSSLQSLIGIEHNYNIYGGGIFNQGRVVSVLCDELHYPDGSEWLDDCWKIDILYLPKSIKYIEKPNEEEMDDRKRDWFRDFWSPVYLRVKTIVVPKGCKEYFTNLFYEDMQQYKDWWFDDELTKDGLEKKIVEA